VTSQLQTSTPVEGVINPAAGEAAKARGVRRIGQLDPDWVAACDNAIGVMAALGVVFQAADLIEAKLVEEPPHPNCWGPRFLKAARAGVIRSAGYGPSRRATVHASICHLWVGAGTAVAA
jgi:hypothetical protein